MADAEASRSSVRSFRDMFGDPKPPEISRKITACVACRKQKIKCHMPDSQPPCARCKKKGLSCTVNRSLQMLLENDVSWKQAIEQKIQKLEETMSTMVNDGSSSNDYWRREEISEDPSSVNEPAPEDYQQGNLGAASEDTGRWKIVIDLESSPSALPGHYLQSTASTQPKSRQDIVSRGGITVENARKYLSEYQNRLDHFVYGILGEYSSATLESIREASPFLATAICAVGSLHLASPDYDLLYKEFIAMSAALSFSKRNTVDDVRALCIGAFWLGDMSWSLVGIAVRIATDLQLHRSFFRALQGDREQHLRTRLYLLVYACDHHFSVPYGRPPITRECEAVRDARKFLECEHATEDDARLVSQVLRWSICSNVYDTFGANVDRPLSDADVPLVRRFSIALDSLRAEWTDRFKVNAHVGNYPRKGVGIQYHFAKLYLCSHALRGSGSNQPKNRAFDVALEVDEIANSAVLSAVSILRAVVSDTEIQSYLNGLPTYFHIMIAFAIVFLLKVSTRLSASVRLDIQEVQRLMITLVSVLKEVAASMHPHHLLVGITKGIDDLLQRSGLIPGPVASVSTSMPQQVAQQVFPDADVLYGDMNLAADGIFDPNFMNEYDLLLGQTEAQMP
ncbi:C6 transcription factor [Talaromyces proteolyticus]|uniref:C6 transcription factor n=1 Tax=Talaromyces proteolyticus TaxID=1131652 RepID=A0AAD4Q425_9EURO|nr:C6 transcription factor [Talaromyces proteolyticus]KAH8702306.1 C6 transcription factor [Talaromyces proteolyticus]